MSPLILYREAYGKKKWMPKDSGVVKACKRARLTVGLNLAYAAGNVIDAVFFHTHYLCIGIMPLAIWFIVSGWVGMGHGAMTEEDMLGQLLLDFIFCGVLLRHDRRRGVEDKRTNYRKI